MRRSFTYVWITLKRIALDKSEHGLYHWNINCKSSASCGLIFHSSMPSIWCIFLEFFTSHISQSKCTQSALESCLRRTNFLAQNWSIHKGGDFQRGQVIAKWIETFSFACILKMQWLEESICIQIKYITDVFHLIM